MLPGQPATVESLGSHYVSNQTGVIPVDFQVFAAALKVCHARRSRLNAEPFRELLRNFQAGCVDFPLLTVGIYC